MYFRSKKDIWFFILIWGPIIGIASVIFFAGTSFIDLNSIGNQIVSVDSILGKIFLIILIVLLLWFWFSNGYIIEEEKLKIKFGPINISIKTNNINEIEKIKSIYAAPALSMDRIKISYDNFSTKVHVSPQNTNKFIKLLLKNNPNINVKDL